MSMPCNNLQNPTDDEKSLTVAMVIGKVEPSANKEVVWTHEEFKSDVKARPKKATSRMRLRSV